MKRKTNVHPTLRRWILWLTLGLWLFSMVLLTCAVAADMLMQLENQLYYYTNSADSRQILVEEPIPGYVDTNMVDQLGYPYYWLNLDPLLPIVIGQNLTNGVSTKEWLWGKWELYYGFEAAVIFYDENREELIRTGDYLTFAYTTSEHWAAEEVDPIGRGYVDLDQIPGGSKRFGNLLSDSPYGDLGLNMFIPLMRLTGWFEGNEFYPTKIESGQHLGIGGITTGIARLADLDSRGHVEWSEMIAQEAPEGQELVTIYVWDAGGYNATPKSFTSQGTHYDTLADLLSNAMESDQFWQYEVRNLFQSVLLSTRWHEDVYGTYLLTAAVRCSPLTYAMVRLIPVYAISLGIVVFILWRMLRRIRLELTEPLEILSGAIRVGHTITPRSDWAEPSAIEEDFVQTRKTLAENKVELATLQAALDYSRNAEEKRKVLISNITHELKTPLAIIHSYAECLSEDVAPEKKQQYLATILEETEKMDGMVLQMLELSRLEAGRVKLSTDQFSLLDLTKSIAEKMQPMMAERTLTLVYDYVQDIAIVADEGRLGQVVTNLLSNAVKYTTAGGQIRVSTFMVRGTMYFRIANTAPHFSEEELEKVWDSFYRADASRSTPGTGLGLPLVKSIITLYGGNCSVRNVQLPDGSDGVEFEFSFSPT